MIAVADISSSGLCYPIRQVDFDRLEVYPSSLRKLQEAIYSRMVHQPTAS